ncbi:transposase [Bradyrhizobium sacchari]|uniref:Transposase n=1 Tax=Bradyrhizobium sacchari TaxID=1399419 RepID=A0A560HL60_9BRAD|nr:transposase [Bradyrhizobium sacchari]TWB66022.1 transposase [Bradyrhizobium sacchari]
MIPLPAGVRVWLATGYTDMRKGFPLLALQVQEILHPDPLGGHLFCFRGRRRNLLKVIWHDGQGACLFTKPSKELKKGLPSKASFLNSVPSQLRPTTWNRFLPMSIP